MAIAKQVFTDYIRSFKFRELFNEMGWNNDRTNQAIVVDNNTFILNSVADKSGFKIFTCIPANNESVPDYSIRKQIETKVTRLFQEHLIIFFDNYRKLQIWQMVVRQSRKPTKITETRYYLHQDTEILYQRTSGLFFEMDQEENITIIDVKTIVSENFVQNTEKVTKKFYERFKKEHTNFLKFITGIDNKMNREWYASLTLNRLMFCYFIQKKGFLDDNKNYLREKLRYCQKSRGKNKFYTFYRFFLLQLFHKGLGAPNHDKELIDELGNIPYLNGGLFDKHELEKTYKDIDIGDQAFEKVFDFFDQYEWHLDTRASATGKEINPDVIGYIFEKYINDRSQMGAYYTKEDITEYISRNCIIPFLLEETQRSLNHDNEYAKIWIMVTQSGDRYINSSVKYGMEFELPVSTSKNFGSLVKTKDESLPNYQDLLLPNETWSEAIERRKKYTEIKLKIESGKIDRVEQFIEYNLDLRQFIQDIIECTDSPVFLLTFYKALNKLTVLDPTCGSGAFLFAALNILEPLYEASIERMENFIFDGRKEQYKEFDRILMQIKSPEHPNLQYFIYKNIILQNLYGVDLMKEAVEIAKLRLFLKLVSTVEINFRKPNFGLEPLPDIDFNIKSGNTLVGFADEAELQTALVEDLMGALVKTEIEDKSKVAANAYLHYKEIQLKGEENFEELKLSKSNLQFHLTEIKENLNKLLHLQTPSIKYELWKESHQPFHWFTEFYDIIQVNKGFDVIIGNPPYVEYSSVRKSYTVNGFRTLPSGNLYAFIIERAIKIQKKESYNGMIIPLSAYCTDRMVAFQQFEFENCSSLFLSFYAERPSKLFEGAERNLAISLFKKVYDQNNPFIFTTQYYKWNANFREHLFNSISYIESSQCITKGIVPKVGCEIEISLINKLRSVKRNVGSYTTKSKTKNILYYRNSGGRYWKIITDFQPEFYLNNKKNISSRESYLYFYDLENLKIIVTVLNSTLYYWYYIMHSDARTNNPSDLKDFPFDISNLSTRHKEKLISLSDKLMKDIKQNAIVQEATYRTGNVRFQQFLPQKSKKIIDEIDRTLAEHYVISEVELDFILNYDMKFRMGKENDEEE